MPPTESSGPQSADQPQPQHVSTSRTQASAPDRRDGAADAADSALRLSELWIPAVISLIVGLRWLLGERHSVYGDEAFHLTNLLNGVAATQGGVFDRFVALYLFNFAYPPAFHLLSAPFVLPAADPVLAGRVYVQFLTLLVSLTLYSVTRLVGGRLAGAVAVLTLLGMPSFVDVSRHYLLEPLLTLEVLLILYFIGRYYAQPRRRYPAIVSALITVGLLTKFNFFFYAAPLFVVPVAVELRGLVARRRSWLEQLTALATIVVPPLLLAGPWYLARSTGSTSMLSALYEAGTLKPGFTMESFGRLVIGSLPLNYSPLFKVLTVVAAATYAGCLVGVPRLGSILKPLTRSQHVIVSSAFIGVITVPIILAVVGLGGELRWHIEATYLLVAVFGILGRFPGGARAAGLSLAALAAVLQLLTIYVWPVNVPAFLRLPVPETMPRPSAVPVGSEALARDIARHEKLVGGTKAGEFAFFFYHEHAGPHFGSVEFYLTMEGAPLTTGIAGFYDRAIDVGNFFDAKYLVEGVGRSAGWGDPENRRYRILAENLPAAFRDILVDVSEVDARFGRFSVHYVPRERVTRQMVLDTIDVGRRLEGVGANVALWDAQRIIWRAKFDTVPGNASLGQEIDAFLSRVTSPDPQSLSLLRTINRSALQNYVTRIHEIRRLVDSAPVAPAPEPLSVPARRRVNSR